MSPKCTGKFETYSSGCWPRGERECSPFFRCCAVKAGGVPGGVQSGLFRAGKVAGCFEGIGAGRFNGTRTNFAGSYEQSAGTPPQRRKHFKRAQRRAPKKSTRAAHQSRAPKQSTRAKHQTRAPEQSTEQSSRAEQQSTEQSTRAEQQST